MQPTTFPEANSTHHAPAGDEHHCGSLPTFTGQIDGGSWDGTKIVIAAWKPDAEDLARLNAGQPVFVAMLGGLCPHFIATEFSAFEKV